MTTVPPGFPAFAHSSSPSEVSDYYTHQRDNSDANPLFSFAEPFEREAFLYGDDPLGAHIKPFRLEIAAPRPKNPSFTDHHSASFPIVSDKIKQSIESWVAKSI